MIDVEATIRAHLAAQSSIVSLTSARIYASRDLPAEYRPTTGAALLFSMRGGPPDYTAHVLQASVQFQAYGATGAQARALDRALFDSLHERPAAGIKWVRCDALGQITSDAAGWKFVLSFYTIWISNP